MLGIRGSWSISQLVAVCALYCGCGDNTVPAPGDNPVPVPGDGSTTITPLDVALTVNVVGPDGETVTGFRWLLERDLTYRINPGVPDPATLAVRFHRSQMPVVQAGTAAVQPMIDIANAYFISVLPDAGYAMGGAQIAPGQTQTTVVVNALPIPTAQATVLVFRDDAPINDEIDLPGEDGLAGFTIKLEDAGGRYGQSGGHQMMDAFGNPLGTTYDAGGNVVMMGDGIILTGPDGTATIKNLSPGKYGITAVPPPGSSWVQTSTLEGTRVIDVLVKANEPPYFMELGPPGYHATIGFVQPMRDTTVLTGGSTISGQVVNLHMSRPPGPYFGGAPLTHTRVWVGLNAGPVGAGRGVFAGKAAPDGSFAISDVPPGSYQLAIWDEALDQIFAFHTVTVNGDGSCGAPGGSCALGQIPVFQWFTRLQHQVFNDLNGNGFRDPGELGIPETMINLRWRDGSIYQSYPTKVDGVIPFDEVFPFFNYLVAEVDNTRLAPTGVTVTVDDGGAIDPSDPWSFGGQLNPQPQSENGGLPYRTETGPILSQAFQGFIGQTSVMQWGKRAYQPGQNGGIKGMVHYTTTRAENDPRFAAAENWEPGIANVTVNLWDATGTVLLNTVKTDSWDENQPTGCQGPPFVFRGVPTDCFDGLKNFNQVRPGLFDGTYAFSSYFPAGVGTGSEVQGLPPGKYLVEVVLPTGYEIQKEEDRNVDFGDSYTPTPQLLPPECVGPMHTVPTQFAMFPLFDENNQPVAPFRAGQQTPLCNRKQVTLNDQQNASADFFLFTYVPLAAHVVGFVLDDAANESDRNSPTFGEKYAPPWLPISFRDWTGREIAHTYSDEFGTYNALVPSTYTVNRPAPSGVSPNMLTICINSPTRASPNDPNAFVLDPHYNPQYSQFCYTFQFMPGTTTYLDTPVLPHAAFAGPDQHPLDCELVTGTPHVFSVDGPEGGPYVSVADGTQTLTIVAPQNGMVEVANPAYDGTNARTIVRDFGFGTTPGTVTLGNISLPIGSWNAGSIVVTVPTGATTGQLTVTRGDNSIASVNAVTVSVGANGLPLHHVTPGETIQQAIDAAAPGTLILVPPGLFEEVVIMWKPVRLQGAGEGTIINALKAPAEKLALWRAKAQALVTAGSVDLLPGQPSGVPDLGEPVTLFSEEGPGILVLAKNVPPAQGGFGLAGGEPNGRIDGFTITGGDSGGIIVNGYAHRMQIGNNRIAGNGGAFGGGVRIGHANLVLETAQGLVHQGAFNDHIVIHHSQISRNGGLDGAGGGISLYAGSDRYAVTDNFICGNFSQGQGGGIGHLGLSDLGVIARNTIVFNESFNQGSTVAGGGIALIGADPLNPGEQSPGTGSVQVTSNTILGNAAGAGDGGGVVLRRINGSDVAAFPNNPNLWHRVDLVNNLITNNVAALAGGGISLSDAARVRILHTVVANNDSTATAGDAFAPGSPNESTPQPAGIVSRRHSPELLAALAGTPEPAFSSPQLVNDIIWHNRSFYFQVDPTVDPPSHALAPLPNAPVYADLAVLGAAGALDPRFSILTDTTGYHVSNRSTDPQFVAQYFNGARGVTIAAPDATTALDVPAAFDEGGNWIRVGFGPLTLADTTTLLRLGNYRIAGGSPARDQGLTLNAPPEVNADIDGQPRPVGLGVDIGAFELQ
ncbi:MAG: hypothetical protein JWO36_4761 [Myxococcales bacterium]|nr:hypothetical protein [Myxococcales bacterium]